ncbi:MAG: CPBP family intramembrane metalloprotease [Planctomycetes bacterium]|nr:CPBP family intramembrane metalloprotease [Planctomycetota bacterium]
MNTLVNPERSPVASVCELGFRRLVAGGRWRFSVVILAGPILCFTVDRHLFAAMSNNCAEWALFGIACACQLLVLSMALWFGIRAGSVREFLSLRWPGWRPLASYAAAWGMFAVVVNIAAMLLGFELREPLVWTPFQTGEVPYFCWGLLAIVVAPVAEEFWYRAAMTNGAVYIGIRPRTVVVSIAFLFAAAHVTYGLSGFLVTFVLGLATGLARFRTGSIWPSVCIHAANNALVLIAFAAFDPTGTSFLFS